MIQESDQTGVKLFKCSDEVPSGSTAFIHMAHLPFSERTYTKQLVKLLNEKGVTTIPSLQESILYDDKVEQYKTFGNWMPFTVLFENDTDAFKYCREAKFPIVSKTAQGAGASNVRILTNWQDTLVEVCRTFSLGGMPVYQGNTQKGYVLWQDYVPNLNHNWRVFIMAKKHAVVTKRWNSPRSNKVDDNGEIKQIDYLKPELLNYVRKFVDTFDFNWCAVDVVETKDGFKVLETSVGFPFWWFEKGGVIFKYHGYWCETSSKATDIWKILLETIKEGYFNEKT